MATIQEGEVPEVGQNGQSVAEAPVGLLAKDAKLLADLKEKIKALPVNERITAVAIYRKIEQYFRQLYPFELKENVNSKNSDKEREHLHLLSCEIIAGQRQCNEKELSGIEKVLKDGEVFNPEEHNKAHRIEDFWLKTFQHSHISKSRFNPLTQQD